MHIRRRTCLAVQRELETGVQEETRKTRTYVKPKNAYTTYGHSQFRSVNTFMSFTLVLEPIFKPVHGGVTLPGVPVFSRSTPPCVPVCLVQLAWIIYHSCCNKFIVMYRLAKVFEHLRSVRKLDLRNESF